MLCLEECKLVSEWNLWAARKMVSRMVSRYRIRETHLRCELTPSGTEPIKAWTNDEDQKEVPKDRNGRDPTNRAWRIGWELVSLPILLEYSDGALKTEGCRSYCKSADYHWPGANTAIREWHNIWISIGRLRRVHAHWKLSRGWHLISVWGYSKTAAGTRV